MGFQAPLQFLNVWAWKKKGFKLTSISHGPCILRKDTRKDIRVKFCVRMDILMDIYGNGNLCGYPSKDGTSDRSTWKDFLSGPLKASSCKQQIRIDCNRSVLDVIPDKSCYK